MHIIASPAESRGGALGLLVGVGLAAISVALQRLLYRFVAPDSYQMLLSAVAISVMYAGFRSGLAALLVAGAGKWFLFLRPEHPLQVADWRIVVRFLLFLCLGLLICWLGQKLHASNRKLKVLAGMLPVCAWCKRVRDEKEHWQQLEAYIHDHSEAEFTHTLCPDCARKMGH